MKLGATIGGALIGVVVGVIAEEPIKKLIERVKGGFGKPAEAPKSAGPDADATDDCDDHEHSKE